MICRLKGRKFGKSILLVINALKNTLYDGDQNSYKHDF